MTSKYQISEFIKYDEFCKGIKITNLDEVLDHIERLLELRNHLTTTWVKQECIRFYVMGYAAGVQSRA